MHQGLPAASRTAGGPGRLAGRRLQECGELKAVKHRPRKITELLNDGDEEGSGLDLQILPCKQAWMASLKVKKGRSVIYLNLWNHTLENGIFGLFLDAKT